MLNLQKLLISDQISSAVDTINSNFEQIALNGGGPMGPPGQGEQGIAGGPGRQGVVGAAGHDGQSWYFSSSDPTSNTQAPATGSQTLWMNTSTGKIFEWNGTSWVLQGTFGAVNYFIRSSNNIAQANYQDTLVISDEFSGTGTAPLYSNVFRFLLKLNASGGNVMMITDGDGNDDDGVATTISTSAFSIASAKTGRTFNVFSQGQMTLNSGNTAMILAAGNLWTSSAATMQMNASNRIELSANTLFDITVTSRDARANTNLLVANTTSAAATEQLQIGVASDPGNVLVVRGNPTLSGSTVTTPGVKGAVIFSYGGRKSTLNTNYMTADRNVQLPDLSDNAAVLREFNKTLYNDNWVSFTASSLYGWFKGSGGSWVLNSAQPSMNTGSIGAGGPFMNSIYMVGSRRLLEANGTYGVGMQTAFTGQYKLIGNMVHLKWTMQVIPAKNPSVTSGPSTEDIIGFHVPLPFDATGASEMHIQAESEEVGTSTPFGGLVFTRQHHTGSCISVSGQIDVASTSKTFTQTPASFQVLPARDTGTPPSNFTGSHLFILNNTNRIDYANTRMLQLSGECFLKVSPSVYGGTQFPDEVNFATYFQVTPRQSSSGGDPIGAITFFAPQATTQFTATGLGVSDGLIGWAVADGRNGTIDMRGRLPYGARDLRNLPSGYNYFGNWSTPDIGTSGIPPEIIGTTGGEMLHTLTRAELPSVGVEYRDRYLTMNTTVLGGQITNDDSVNHLSISGSALIPGSPSYMLYKDTVTSNLGSGHAQNNMPPYYAGMFIQKIF